MVRAVTPYLSYMLYTTSPTIVSLLVVCYVSKLQVYILTAIITLLAVGVKFTTEPSNQTAANGSSVTFVCFVDGSDPISYQWFKNGDELQGENNSLLMLDPVLYNDYGVYHCVVNNSVNIIQSRGAALTGVYDALHY